MVGLTVATATLLALGAMVASGATAALPTVTEIPATAGTHGYPYDAVPEAPTIPGAPFVNLGEVGYTQREFKMSGADTIYKESGSWSSNGKWGVTASQTNVPYTTRLL